MRSVEGSELRSAVAVALALGAMLLAASACTRAVQQSGAADAGSTRAAHLPDSATGAAHSFDAAAAARASDARDAGIAFDATTAARDAAAPMSLDAGGPARRTRDAAIDDAGAHDTVVARDAAMHVSASVTIYFTTVLQGGKFDPRNVGAVWVEDGSGTFVKALNRWAGAFASRLTAFNAASGGNLVDAVTTATAATFGPREARWDMTDLNHNEVPDGTYQVKIEVTDQNTPGPIFILPIRKGTGALDVHLPDQSFLTNISLDYQP